MKDLPNQIITLVNSLDKEQLLQLNQLVVHLVKTKRDKELTDKTYQFRLAEFVFFYS